MARIEENYDLRKILEALINELSARGTIASSTAANIVNEGKPSS